ncbi:lipase-like PAD4 [Cryptomeria japonica]|uniref:lipase-like PAD4 n=1 Tax=Cryptomeria japonica TaxID=3369 RepID=UPI0025AC2127|nr:lipase-like PAD4 [Cryptomeria japonica]
MAQLEWYKSTCKAPGYYDTFKPQIDRKHIRADECRMKLASFWDGIVGLVEMHQLPSDFQTQNKWINAGNAYMKLVEPLDIASYYQNDSRHGNSGNYLSAGIRPHRHEVLQKRLDDKNRTRTGRDRRPRTKFASWTEDSCFWAHVEEALKILQHQAMNAPQIEGLENFECYMGNMNKNRSISDEVFLEGSSVMTWWQRYRDLRHQSQQWQSSSPLFNFMNNQGWNVRGN